MLDLAADYWRAKVAERADDVLVTAPWMVERAAELGVRASLWAPGVDTDAFTPALRDQWLHGSWSRKASRWSSATSADSTARPTCGASPSSPRWTAPASSSSEPDPSASGWPDACPAPASPAR